MGKQRGKGDMAGRRFLNVVIISLPVRNRHRPARLRYIHYYNKNNDTATLATASTRLKHMLDWDGANVRPV